MLTTALRVFKCWGSLPLDCPCRRRLHSADAAGNLPVSWQSNRDRTELPRNRPATLGRAEIQQWARQGESYKCRVLTYSPYFEHAGREKPENPQAGRAIGFQSPLARNNEATRRQDRGKWHFRAVSKSYGWLITSRVELEKIVCLRGRSTDLSFRWKAIVGRTRRTELHPVDGKSFHTT